MINKLINNHPISFSISLISIVFAASFYGQAIGYKNQVEVLRSIVRADAIALAINEFTIKEYKKRLGNK